MSLGHVEIVRGNTVFVQGDTAGLIYVIADGRVQISRSIDGEERPLAELGPGDFFGEMSTLMGTDRQATATVIEDCKLLVYDEDTFRELITTNPSIAQRIIETLARRLRATTEQLVAALDSQSQFSVDDESA